MAGSVGGVEKKVQQVGNHACRFCQSIITCLAFATKDSRCIPRFFTLP
jgi:hypothetical protein